MRRIFGISAALLLAAANSPAAAQSWGLVVGAEFGPPLYGPPPVYYEYAEPPYWAAEPPVYYEAPPVVVVPRERRVRIATPDDVLDRLDAAGYREFGPMARRGGLYRLSAVAPEGDLVALEVSAVTGEVENEFVLQPRRKQPSTAEKPRRTRTAAAPPPEPAPPAQPPTSGPPAPPMKERLKPLPPPEAEPDGDGDPLVVY